MLNHPKSTLYSLIITAFLFVLLTGCSNKNHGKADAVIEIDLTQQGKTLTNYMHGDSIKKVSQGVTPENLQAALTEAALLIGMERNEAVVKIAADSLRAYKTPSEYAIKLFADNRPDKVMPTKVTMVIPETQSLPVISATAGTQIKAGMVIIKLVNPYNMPKVCRVIVKYKQQIKYIGEAYVMTSGNILDGNTVKVPEKVVPMTKELKGLKNTFNFECPANSIVVIKLRYKKRLTGLGNCC